MRDPCLLITHVVLQKRNVLIIIGKLAATSANRRGDPPLILHVLPTLLVLLDLVQGVGEATVDLSFAEGRRRVTSASFRPIRTLTGTRAPRRVAWRAGPSSIGPFHRAGRRRYAENANELDHIAPTTSTGLCESPVFVCDLPSSSVLLEVRGHARRWQSWRRR